MLGTALALIGLATAAASDCRPVDILDETTGRALRGIEDIAVDRRTGTLYLSANDRFAVENAGRSGTDGAPQGGIYRLDPDTVPQAGTRALARDLTAGFKRDGNGLLPHGVDLMEDAGGGATLLVVNRHRAVSIEVFAVGAGGLDHRARVVDRGLCRANDVVGLASERFVVSNDGAACGAVGRWIENIAGLARGSVVLIDRAATGASWRIRTLVAGIRVANGLALDNDRRRLFVASTRGESLLVYRLAGAEAIGAGAIDIDGGPDNLLWAGAARTRLLVAVHPSLWDLALYRYRWLGRDRAPSRVLAVDVDRGRSELLHDDAEGRLLSAATVAAHSRGRVFIGSVADAGLLVCGTR